MERSDFQNWKIQFFTPEEIEATGAKLSQVQVRLVVALDKFRKELGRPLVLIKDGMTTGKHKAKEHPGGLAADGYIPGGEVSVKEVFKAALEAGFRGIGIYWNGAAYSFHLDLGPDRAFWTGKKTPGVVGWKYGELIIDPRKDG